MAEAGTEVVDLSDPGIYRAPDDECDMIMKGGITSGVVYPQAVCRLATSYRFRHVGGASAGAIAAVFAAAAEHGRAHGGFVTLAGVPDELGETLASLFQPSRRTRAAYRVLMACLEPRWGKIRKGGASAALLLWHGFVGLLAGLAAILVPAFGIVLALHGAPGEGSEWWDAVRTTALWLPLAAVLALVAAPVWVVLRTLSRLPANGYGLCDGHTRHKRLGPPPLTDWLCEQLDELAKLGPGDTPLTFGHLWGPQAVEQFTAMRQRERDGQRVASGDWRRVRDQRDVDLEVMTTNLTFRRPYRFPFVEPGDFYFCPRRFRTYFPDAVVEHMVAHSAEVPDLTDDGDDGAAATEADPAGPSPTISMLCPCHGERVHSLPEVCDLPVVLAARLSLSFPGLISAVPLFCVDWSRRRGRRRLIEAWFSDGGIASNFPMHLFDSFWPKRPTFGINLQGPHPDFPDQKVWRPRSVRWGIVPRSHPIDSMVGFLSAILDTMQNWVDSTQVPLPGYRDRVTELRHQEGEGGINLKMPAPTIHDLAVRGGEAAAEFDDFDFDLHRWIRYRVSMSELDEMIDTLAERYGGEKGYETFLAAFGPTAADYGLGSDAAAAADRAATGALMDLSATWATADHPANAGQVPQPKPTLRIVPRQ